MTQIGKLLPLGARRGSRSAKRTAAGSLVALVGFAPSIIAPASASPSAGADTVGSLQSQIAAKEAHINAVASRIHSLAVQYTQASVAASNLGQQVAEDNARISALKRQVASARGSLQQEAILSYTGSALNGLNLRTQTGGLDPAVTAEYLQIASGDVSDTVDRYHLEQRQLATTEAVVRKQQAQARAQARAADAARRSALTEASAAQTQLNGLQAQLVQARQAAARAAAARRAAATRQTAAAHAAVARRSVPAPQGAPVNNGFVSAVRTLVSPPQPAPAAAASGSGGAGGVWLALRTCESSDNYRTNTGNGFYGAYQFTQATWTGLGYPGRPDLEPPAMQDAAAMKDQALNGWGQWPACSATLGL